MAAVFKEITITWEGVDYSITPTMRLLNKVEQHVSLSALANSLATGQPKMTHVAAAVAIFLQSKGVDVTDEDVYVALCNLDITMVRQMSEAIITAAFPSQSSEGEQGKELDQKTTKKPRK
ncbi:hypothetical protein JHL22_04955 [Advenella sp. WQ 585]|uniref:Phage protein n=1 Tax=Advenella mandrilli TaxID=2800330 RepID=A0ABS1E9U7_9BURK|nr:hypothetical protein [Advenella mandrilli]MBK1780559.1 hypothetical protein [Advenella mandrilli]